MWNFIILVECLINLALHMIGFYLLLCLYRFRKHTIQRLLLIHLSLFDAVKNLLFIPYLCMELMGMENTILQQYMDICFATVIPSLYYSLIIFITVDRFLAICLNIKYRVYITVRRGKCCMLLMWALSILLGGILSILYYCGIIPKYQGRPSFRPYNMYIYLALDVFFIIIALGTYIFIFRQYHSGAMEMHLRISRVSARADDSQPKSVFQRFRDSKFYTSAIIICNFMILIAIPDSVFTLYLHISKADPPYAAQVVLTLMNLLSDLCDFVIYVVMQKQVRKLFMQTTYVCLKRKPPTNMLLKRSSAVKRIARSMRMKTLSQIGGCEV